MLYKYLALCTPGLSIKRAIQCSMFPKKISFSGKDLRTPEIAIAYQVVMPGGEPVYADVHALRTHFLETVDNYEAILN